MRYILAMDQGTTSSRAILFDRHAVICSVAQQEINMLYPSDGWVEQDGTEIYNTQLQVAQAVLDQAGLTAADICAIGITNQRETTIVWDRQSGKPIYHAIVWQDRRTAPMCETLKQQGYEPLFRERTGLLLDPYFSATKLVWILDTIPGARQRAEQGELLFGTIDSWLLWNLTGGKQHYTDLTNASRTLMCNIHTGTWDEELLDILMIPKNMLPTIVDSSAVYGHTDSSLFEQPIPIAAMAGDQQAALFGQGCVATGQSKNTYGTGCFMLAHTGCQPVFSKNRLLTTVALKIDNQIQYALEGSVFVAGSAIQWLRDGLGIIRSSADVEPMAQSVTDSNGVTVVPAFTGLGAPYWDPYARGSITGLTRSTTAAHIVRATLESIALQTVDLVRAIEHDTGDALTTIRVDGGASVNDLLMQMQADMLGIPVIRSAINETTALGAALLAGLATGYWLYEELPFAGSTGKIFQPKLEQTQATARYQEWSRAVKQVMLH